MGVYNGGVGQGRGWRRRAVVVLGSLVIFFFLSPCRPECEGTIVTKS